jgi:outer membrane murein-binding lipoprotein Lpp
MARIEETAMLMMREKSRGLVGLAAVLALAVLAGCTQLEKDVGQCEAGVGDLSAAPMVAPDC